VADPQKATKTRRGKRATPQPAAAQAASEAELPAAVEVPRASLARKAAQLDTAEPKPAAPKSRAAKVKQPARPSAPRARRGDLADTAAHPAERKASAKAGPESPRVDATRTPAAAPTPAGEPIRAIVPAASSSALPAKRAPAKQSWGDKLLARMRSEKEVTAAEVIRQIAKGPQGPQVIAAFDFDGTLLGGLSAAMLMQTRMKRKDIKRAELADSIGGTLKVMTKRMDAKDFITRGFTHWAGKTEAEMEELAAELFENKLQDSVFPEMREVLEAHRKAGHTIVVATAATRYQVGRMVEALGIENLRCTEVEVVDGKLTGKLVGESLFGEGKANALEAFIVERGGDFADTHFYADGDEEIGLMEKVGHPHPVNPGRKLAEAAKAEGWPVLRLQSRGGSKPVHYVRGIAGLLSIMPIAQAGLAVGLLTRDKRQVANVLIPTWIQAQLDLAGVKLRVSGRKNLHARRPAVFIFNHRNNFDGSFAQLLIKTDVAGLGKKEFAQNPIGKFVTSVMPMVLVERGGGDAAKAATMLQPAVDAVAEGYSILLSPEGTRVRGHHNSVGPFKKGAFHIAIDAGVPIVPIVIRNALDVAPRDGALRPGTVDIAVLPPIPIEGWTKDNMGEKIEKVRQQFIDTLNDWPEPDENED
jgi:putative phosphoserine phosphatase/1-acylglycerol-3-phosphate O-acyltransferase